MFQVFMIAGMSISELNVSVIDEFVRLDMSAEYAYPVPLRHLTCLRVVFCQRYERCSTCGTTFEKSIGGAMGFS